MPARSRSAVQSEMEKFESDILMARATDGGNTGGVGLCLILSSVFQTQLEPQV